jgi:inosose dehydratase
MIDTHVRNARFLRDAGGLYLQLTVDRPAGRAVTDADYVSAGRLLSDVGRRTADLGVPLGFHPHMGSLAERPVELDRVMDAADPRYVRLLLDVAHYQQGGGDSVGAIRRYRDRLMFLHIKDVRDGPGANEYQFVELGQGRVNVREIFAALTEVSFRGWAVVELDSVPDPTRSPKDSAAMSKRYLESIGIHI